jgi:hypothetical protein
MSEHLFHPEPALVNPEHMSAAHKALAAKWDRILSGMSGILVSSMDYFGVPESTQRDIQPYLDRTTGFPDELDGNPVIALRWSDANKGAAKADQAWFGSVVQAHIVLPVIPATPVLDSWENSSSRGVLESTQQETTENETTISSLREALIQSMVDLSEREIDLLRMRFGLDGGPEMTLEEAGREFGLTRERMRQIEAKALSRLRHPFRAGRLRTFIDTSMTHAVESLESDAYTPSIYTQKIAEERWHQAYQDYRNGFISVDEAAKYARAAVNSGVKLKVKIPQRTRQPQIPNEEQQTVNHEAIRQRDRFEEEARRLFNQHLPAELNKVQNLDSELFRVMQTSFAKIASIVHDRDDAGVLNNYGLLANIIIDTARITHINHLFRMIASIHEVSKGIPKHLQSWKMREERQQAEKELETKRAALETLLTNIAYKILEVKTSEKAD